MQPTSSETPSTSSTDEPSRTDLNMTATAARQHWPITGQQQEAIVKHVADLVTSTSKPRTAITAAKTIAAFGRLAIEQQKLDGHQADPAEEPSIDPRDQDVRELLLDETHDQQKERLLNKWKIANCLQKCTSDRSSAPTGSSQVPTIPSPSGSWPPSSASPT
jgi:hypothetical protein